MHYGLTQYPVEESDLSWLDVSQLSSQTNQV